MEFFGAVLGLITKVIQFIWVDIEKEIRELQNYIDKLDEDEIEELIIVSAKENANVIDFTHKTTYIDFFKQLESVLSKIDNKCFLSKKCKEDNVKKIIIAIPNRLLWLTSIYCLTHNSLKSIWNKYSHLVSLYPLLKYSPIEMGAMDENRFNDIYADDKVEANKIYYMDHIIRLAYKFEKELGINIIKIKEWQRS